jgi:hypothetical protein
MLKIMNFSGGTRKWAKKNRRIIIRNKLIPRKRSTIGSSKALVRFIALGYTGSKEIHRHLTTGSPAPVTLMLIGGSQVD